MRAKGINLFANAISHTCVCACKRYIIVATILSCSNGIKLYAHAVDISLYHKHMRYVRANGIEL